MAFIRRPRPRWRIFPGFARGSIIANRFDTEAVQTGGIVRTETRHMKIISRKLNNQGGFALLLTIFITGLVGLMLVAYLSLLSNSNQAVMRSQAWNSAMPMIEAGLEDALSQLNAHGSTNLACDGWTQSGGVYWMNRTLGDGAYYVSISNWVANLPGNVPVVESRAYVPMPVQVASAHDWMFAAVSVPDATRNYIGRGVRVNTTRDYLFTKAMVAKGQIDMRGNNVTTDSFNSSDPNYSTNTQYTSTKRKAKGDVATDSQLVDSLISGNANIYGHISTGPNGTASIGPNGSVGDLAWHASGSSGIEPTFSADDMNVSLPDVQLPFTSGAFTPTGGFVTNISTSIGTNASVATTTTYPSGNPISVTTNLVSSSVYPLGSPGPVVTNWNGGGTKVTGYTYPTFTANYSAYTTNSYVTVAYYDYILGDGNYQLSSLSGNIYVNGAAVLLVTSSATPNSITIADGKSLQLYNQASSFDLAGNVVLNGNGTALQFGYWGLPSNTSVSMHGNAGLTGTIYAPEAALTLGGGGNNIQDFIGAVIADTITMNGHFNFHYDEALDKVGPYRNYIVTAWWEMKPIDVANIYATGP